MTPRIDVTKHLGSGLGRAMLALSNESRTSELERQLLELDQDSRLTDERLRATASTCTPRTRALPVKPSSASTH